MSDEVPLTMLAHFQGEYVSVATTITSESQDEEGQVTLARVSYTGWLIDMDDNWIVLGEYGEKHVYPLMILKVSEVVYVELAQTMPNMPLDKAVN
jgi:hypothetical protein